ncbi:MAG: MBL fold metallo-hydrolase, partial [Bdellovibrionales bacterium]|nr:MBL fold metallo-hydrolase [Bdellovibrionales bacterium]
MTNALLQILGSGTSTGVPIPGCTCAVCTSGHPRNHRYRTSAVLKLSDGQNVLIDATTDLRSQALAFEVTRVDAVLFTHGHSDHILGTDDLRAFNFVSRKPIPCFATEKTYAVIRNTFPYIFSPDPEYQGGMLAQLNFQQIE